MVMMPAMLERFLREEDGASLAEATITLSLLVFMLAAFVEFTSAVHQWNMAVKGVEMGARLAAISDPVDSSIKDISGVTSTVPPGDPLPNSAFTTRVCTITNIAANGKNSGSCSPGTYDGDAMARIIYGSDPTQCGNVAPGDYSGICDVFPAAARGTVEVTYANGGLGYAGRPGGAVPVIQVKLKNLSFDLAILDAFIPNDVVSLPEFNASAVGEDLSKTYTN